MIIIKIILLLLHFTIVPMAVGNFITDYSSLDINENPLVKYITGFFGQLAIFYLLTMVVSVVQDFARYRDPIRGCFVILCVLYTMVLVAIVINWASEVFPLENEGGFKGLLAERKSRVKKKADASGKKLFTYIYMAIFVVALLVQTGFAITYQSNENSYDDYDYVAASESNIANNVISVTSYNGAVPSTSAQRMAVSWTTYISYLSVVTQLDCATICHSCLTVLLMLIAYGIYYYMASQLFEKLEDRMVFMCILAALIIFGYYSHYSLTFRMLATIWQGKAVLYALVLPFLLIYLPKLFRRPEKGPLDLLPVFAISLGACSLTLMSMLLVSIEVGFMWLLTCIDEKKLIGTRSALVCLLGPGLEGVFYLIFKVVENTGRSL